MNYEQWFPERLSQLRHEKGVSARDMSLSLGQSESYINKIENSRTLPSMAGFFYICEYLNIDPMEFFDYNNQSPLKSREIASSINMLSTHNAELVLQLIKELNKSNKKSSVD